MATTDSGPLLERQLIIAYLERGSRLAARGTHSRCVVEVEKLRGWVAAKAAKAG